MKKEDKYEYNNANWEDQLTKYNDTSITYDNIGNPLTIGDASLTWINGRELSSYTDINNTVEYKYNKDGIRTSKKVNEIETKYYTENNNIIFEITGNNMLYYIREVNGSIIGLKYNSDIYYYIKNAQEDVIGILDYNLQQIVSYEYDSWGNVISIKDNNNQTISAPTHIGIINPYRYRSYYYDVETNLYYLNSRYYNPVLGRFINQDITTGEIGNILSHNMYQYAFNNPINYHDDQGEWPRWLTKVAIGLAAIAVGVIVTAAVVASGGSALPVVVATAQAAAVAGIKAAVVAGAIGAATSTVISTVKSISSGENLKTTVKKATSSVVDGFSNGFMAGGIVAGVSQIASAGFKIATSHLGISGGNNTGIQLGSNVKVLSPNAGWHTKEIGGTLFKIGNNFRMDVGSSSLLHMHGFELEHIPFGTIGAGIYGGTR